MLKMNKVSFIRFINISLVSVFLMASAGQAIAAKGSGGGRTFDVALSPGSCVLANNAADPLATPSMLIRSSQGINYFIMQVVGSNSVGTWDVTFTKDGVPGTTIKGFVVPPPGGWALTGGSADKGAKTLKAVGVARNVDNGTVCTATIEKIF
jgi:hypothetical protein